MFKNLTLYIQIHKQLVVKLLVAIIVCAWANTAFFTHTHTLQSGKITHSHPMGDSLVHTVGEIQAIEAATVYAALEIDTPEYQLTKTQIFESLNYSVNVSLASFVGFNKPLRGPPVRTL